MLQKNMKIITVSREFGSGGREIGKRLADILGFDYYDSEIITSIAKASGLDPDYVEKALDNHGWQNIPVTFRSSFTTAPYLQSNKVNLMLEQKRVIEEIAALGKDFVIVGRNADVILEQYHPFNIFVCANMEEKVKRCKERARKDENLTDQELIRMMKQIDKVRAQSRELLTSSKWGQRGVYHLMINTGGWEIKELAAAVADFATRRFQSII